MKLIRHLYRNIVILGKSLGPVKVVYYFYRYYLIPKKSFIRSNYKKIFGKYPNLENPSTLNEKIQWLKLHDRTPLHTLCADKYRVREYVTEKIGEKYLVPLVLQTKKPKHITAENLPNYPVVVKTNHDCGGVYTIYDKFKIDYLTLQRKIRKRLKSNYYYQSKEWQYKNIHPRIVVEKLLLCSNGKIPNDYKFHCFHGEPKVVTVSIDREGVDRKNIYDINWEPLLFSWIPQGHDSQKLRGEEIDIPKNYNKMIEIVKKLAAPFAYVRIDLYNIDGLIYCGEITFHQGSGMDLILPVEWDEKLGNLLNLEEAFGK